MKKSRFRRTVSAGALVAMIVLSSCSYLRDAEPFTITIEYNENADGTISVTPLEFQADGAFGEVQVVNNTEEKHGFSIKDLGVFEEILAKGTGVVAVDEAKDGESYTFYCQLHDNEFAGTMNVVYLSEEER